RAPLRSPRHRLFLAAAALPARGAARAAGPRGAAARARRPPAAAGARAAPPRAGPPPAAAGRAPALPAVRLAGGVPRPGHTRVGHGRVVVRRAVPRRPGGVARPAPGALPDLAGMD